jgi:hypothetical protein
LAQRSQPYPLTPDDLPVSIHCTIQSLDALIEEKYFDKALIPRITKRCWTLKTEVNSLLSPNPKNLPEN